MIQEEYTKTFSSFSGSDIVATFNGRIIGELQGISYTIQREVAPVYTMGSPDPRSFSKGKRAISGDMVFVQFDRDALIEEMKKEYASGKPRMLYQTFAANANGTGANGTIGLENQILNGLKSTRGAGNGYGIETWDEQMTDLGYGSTGEFNPDNLTDFFVPEYTDQLMPFNVAITMANESGGRAGMEILGVTMQMEGSGYSIDDIISAKAYKFVARKIKNVTRRDSLVQSGAASANAVLDNRSIATNQ
ncbi:hypothetical protein ACQR3P_28510 [Rhodococcus sp. IEGM1300]